MDQQALRDLERRCVQEEPPPCRAACPLHVDVRAFVACMADNQWDRARAVLHKTMPLPGILGRICDAPCRRACNRRDRGGAIAMADLERACIRRGSGTRRVMPLPGKNQQVAVVNSGLCSLTAAWDLARKGYAVTLLEPGPVVGGGLRDTYAPLLSRAALETELDLLVRLGVRFEVETGSVSEDACRGYLDQYDAVYVGLDGGSGDPWLREAGDVSAAGAAAGLTHRPGLFATGNHPSPVWQAARGRWAATTMDRWLQKVSLTAGREKEGPYQTRLHTDLAAVQSLPPVPMADPPAGYRADEARQEAARCLQCQCLECVKVCAYLEQFGGYPKTYAREIYNNESMVMGERKANRLINSCSLCGLCETVCPHGFAMQDLCLAARQSMVARERMPPSAHDFALADMAFSQGEDFALARHAPGTTRSRYLFFPGCQLGASAPAQVRRVYDYLRENLGGGVGLMLGCCGAPAHWGGRQAQFAAELARWAETWQELGRPRTIMACATCLHMFREHLPEAGVVSLWEVLESTGLPGSCLYRPFPPMAIHDPCTTRDEPAVQQAVRRILSRLEVAVEELDLGREQTQCCGFGGLMESANPVLAREVAVRRGRQNARDYLTYCAMCRDALAGAGKPALHLLDLLFAEPGETDPARRPRPGWSRRRENRARLKTDLCRELWGDGTAAENGVTAPQLVMAAEVAQLVDSRRILQEDLRRVIKYAEHGGPRFHHGQSGQYLAARRLSHATFWVVYSRQGDGFRVHGAYAHRMEVLGP